MIEHHDCDADRCHKVIVSLFDASGEWSRPYREAGYTVLQYDHAHNDDIEDITAARIFDDMYYACCGFHHDTLHTGILAAPPCTDFAGSGARWWAAKDEDGRTAEAVKLMRHTFNLIHHLDFEWWALENPVGRVNTLLPELAEHGPWYWQPHWYGDAYTKKTGLWGTFNNKLPRTNVEPVMFTDSKGHRGSWQWAKLGGKSERTKALRSQTPAGFAQAFFAANR